MNHDQYLEYISKRFAENNITYGGDLHGEPYRRHLEEVEGVLDQFGMTRVSHPELHGGAIGHDFFEDVKDASVSELVLLHVPPRWIYIAWLLTDPQEKFHPANQPSRMLTRAEKKAMSYPKIASDEAAIIVKLADRIANVERGGKIDMYRKEHADFRKALHRDDLVISAPEHAMWNHLDILLAEEEVENPDSHTGHN